jgi:putative methionine-R-sulfoxide reductase with GAF domain
VSVSTRALEALDRILNRGGDADDVLRAVVGVLAEEPGIAWAGIAFLDEGELVLGPEAGVPEEARRTRIPITYQGNLVGELWVDGDAEQAFLERVAVLVSAHVLIGWDTRGERWEP